MAEISEKMIEEKQREERIRSLMSNTSYIEWLIDFTEGRGGFYDSDWDNPEEKLNPEDQERIKALPLFFSGIFNRAKSNSIHSSMGGLEEFYHIKYGNVGLEIGCINGQGTSYYCKRIPLEHVIDFMDIMTPTKKEYDAAIMDRLRVLSNTIECLYNNGTPATAMIEAVNDTIDRLMSDQQEVAPRVRERHEKH